MSRLSYILRRIGITILLLFAINTFLFLAFRLMPGSYATVLAGRGASPEQIQHVRELWGLNQPLYVQYYQYLENLFNGSLGVSRVSKEPVWETIRTRLMNSFILTLPALVVAFILGSAYGGLLGRNLGSRFEKYGIIPPTSFGAMPDFLIAMIMVTVFSLHLDIFPTGGIVSVETYRTIDTNFELYFTADFWFHYILPFATIVFRFLYFPAMIMRSGIVDILDEGFIKYQKLAGLKSSTRYKRIMKHASLPVITLVPVVTARALSGLVLVEIVFNWPGVGKLLFDAVLIRDTPVIQFAFLLVAAWIVVGNFFVDILYTVIDPRISMGGSEQT